MSNENKSLDFIREAVDADVKAGKHDSKVVTRFPPEPNGFLHIGHAKAICLDFDVAAEYNGVCNLRMDDTNPAKENYDYVNAIVEDIEWLGYEIGDNVLYASDYFEKLYEAAITLIKRGKAYVCNLSGEEWEKYRGDSTRPGTPPPGRQRSIEENLDLFARMRAGEFEDGSYVLRANIDMESPNIHMRDPVLYRIMREHHFRQGDDWCIYPMYDFAHCLEDAIEGITHSFCTLEFEIHRPLYDWVLENVGTSHRPRQYEFSRLNLSYTVMSKRLLLRLVKENHVSGWDDPRMPTLSGMRRRGVPAEAIRNFVRELGITKVNSVTDMGVLERHIRDVLNKTAPRYLGVLDPVKVTIKNYPEDKVEYLEGINNPEDPEAGTREIPFSREIYIERSDFMVDPPKGYFRLAPGAEVRLRYAYFITCVDYKTDEKGNVTEIICTYDPESKGGSSPDGRRVRGTMHWVAKDTAVKAKAILYDRLFTVERPGSDGMDFLEQINPDSNTEIDCYLEPALKDLEPGDTIQLERLGYFCCEKNSGDTPVLNRTVTLRDSWSQKQN